MKNKETLNKLNKIKINHEFINGIRLSINIHEFSFDDSFQTNIVPKNLTHDYLLKHFNVDKSISKFYYAPTRDLITDSDYNEFEKLGYHGNIDTILRPYPIIIYGAFFSRKAMFYRLLDLINGSENVKLNGLSIEYLSDLDPYFKKYSKGFEFGFNNFDMECIDPFLTDYSDKGDYIYKVFEYLTKHIIFTHSWTNNHYGFTVRSTSKIEEGEIIGANEDGKKQGYFYKAWAIVFSNNQLFKPLFEDYYKKGKKQESNKNGNVKNDYSQKQVAIAYFLLNKSITIENYLSILKKHTNTTSSKILQKLIVKTNQLTNLRENKTSDTKHLKDLQQAKRLISGMKNKDAENKVIQVISTFEANFKRHYQ